MDNELTNVAKIQLQGNWHWAIISELCIALQEKGYTTYFQWNNGDMIIKMRADKQVPDTAFIKRRIDELLGMDVTGVEAVKKPAEGDPKPPVIKKKRGRPPKV